MYNYRQNSSYGAIKQRNGKVKTMKNEKTEGFFKTYFGFFKEIKKPIRSGAEANKLLKTCKKFRNFYLILALVSTIVGGLLQDIPTVGKIIFNVLIFVELPAFVIGGIAIFWVLDLKKIVEKFDDLACTNCDSRILYDENTSYDVLRKYEKKVKETDKNGRPVIRQTHFADVKIHCKCQNCGTEKNINKTLTYARYVNGDRIYLCEIPELVERYFGDIE